MAQLLTPDASGRGIWAWHTTANVTSATRIAARLLRQAGDESTTAVAKPGMFLEGQMRSLTSVMVYG